MPTSRVVVVLAAVVMSQWLLGCYPVAKPYQSKLDPLAIQQMQTQEFETNKKILYAAAISVFQDTGFTIESSDFEAGVITAKSPNSVAGTGRRSSLGHSVFERATAFVEESRAGYTRLRLSYLESRNFTTAYGNGADSETPNENPVYYERVFNKIRDAVFLRKALHVPTPVRGAPTSQ